MDTSLELTTDKTLQDMPLHSLAESYGRQNANMLHLIDMAQAAVLYLCREGFTVLGVKLDGSKPVIRIMNIAQCAVFVSATTVSKTSECGRELTRVALIKECQIEWVERGH